MFKTTTSLEDAAEFLFSAEALQNSEVCLCCAFLGPWNVLVDDFNNLVLKKLPGEICMYPLFLKLLFYILLSFNIVTFYAFDQVRTLDYNDVILDHPIATADYLALQKTLFYSLTHLVR
jgi:hypothetical protein